MGRVICEYFSEAEIELNREIANHPILCERLSKHPASERELRLAEIAAYCDVVLDGTYTAEDIERLCEILWKKLKGRDSRIILVN